MRRVVSVWLPTLSTDRLKKPGSAAPDEPLAVAESGGHRRLVAINRAAERVGVRAGMSVADALAIHPSLRLAAAAPAEEQALLTRLAEWCVAYSPYAAPDSWHETIAGAGLWLDIAGCAHLWGDEAALLGDLVARLSRLGFTARAAVADTAGAAWAWARFGAGGILPKGGQRDALAGLPVTALRLHPDCVSALMRLGLRRIGDLYPLARGPLAARFGAAVAHRLDQALGAVDEPLSPLRPPQSLAVERRFVTPIGRGDDVEAAIEGLLPQLLARLERNQQGVRRLLLDIFRVDSASRRIAVGTSRPSRDAAALFRLLLLHLDGLDCGFGVESLSLTAIETGPLPARQTDMEDKEQSESVAQLVDSLGNRLGFRRLQRFAPHGSHVPERAVRRLPPDRPPSSEPWPALRRPPILLARPETVAVTAPLPDAPPLLFRWRDKLHRVRAAEGPERLAAEWWREDQPSRDYYLVEDQEGERFWLYRLGLPGEFNPARWFLHGLFS
jgi:protein ImuB